MIHSFGFEKIKNLRATTSSGAGAVACGSKETLWGISRGLQLSNPQALAQTPYRGKPGVAKTCALSLFHTETVMHDDQIGSLIK